MTFGEVGDLLEQKVHCDFEPSSSSGAQRGECELGLQRQKEYGGIHGLLSDGLWTYNSTPEMSLGQQMIGSRSGNTARPPGQAGQLTIDLGLCNTRENLPQGFVFRGIPFYLMGMNADQYSDGICRHRLGSLTGGGSTKSPRGKGSRM